jgi:ketosteroid isomerase-like protein
MPDVADYLVDAMNRHDPAAVAACSAPDYRSEQPVHPSRNFTGNEQVLANWASVFDGVPDFHADLIASVSAGSTERAEIRWQGTHRDGSRFEMAGVTVLGTRDDQIAWARLYLEPVEESGGDIAAAVQEPYQPS